jgi:hypothetical protein
MKEQKNEFTLKGKLRCGHKEQQADFSSSAPQAISDRQLGYIDSFQGAVQPFSSVEYLASFSH